MQHLRLPLRQRARARLLALCLLGGVALGAPSRADSVIAELVPDESRLASVVETYGPGAGERLRQWRLLIETLPRYDTAEQLRRVNDFFNALQFVDDAVHWGQEDYWATPAELLGSNGGDCEDFAIAKYFTLRAAGVPAEHMRITYVKALTLDQAHMVLTYYEDPGGEPVVLDNIDPQIKPASLRGDLLPVYSFNGDNLWLAQQLHGPGRRVGDAERIGRWRRLLARMKMTTRQ